MNVCELFANAESRNAVFGWSCNFTNLSLTAPGSMEFKMKAARFDGITVKNHMLWWDDWSFVETLKAFAQQEYLKLVPIASNQLGADYVATRISNSVCLTPDGESAWAWGEIALLLESLDREQLRSFGTLWLAPNGTRAGFHTNRLVEVLENCYTVSTFALEQTNAPAIEVKPLGTTKPSDLASVVEGVVRAGMANVLNIASKAKAVDRCNAAMQELLKTDSTKAKLTLEEWRIQLGQARKTICKTEAYLVTIPSIKSQNEAMQREKAMPLSGEKVSKKVSKETEE